MVGHSLGAARAGVKRNIVFGMSCEAEEAEDLGGADGFSGSVPERGL